MVKGISVFKEYFKDYQSQYTFIGGTACDILMNDAGLDFRATKDLDIVLIVEALTKEFGIAFWKFIRDGGYSMKEKSNGKLQFYRFSNPGNPEFPVMLEIFSKTPNTLSNSEGVHLTPIHISDECSSLSAILLSSEYYNILLEGKYIIDEIPVLKTEYLIPFKAKAYLDLKLQKETGVTVDSRNITKHKNDVFRLFLLLTGNEKVVLNDQVKLDMNEFAVAMESETIDFKSLGIKNLTKNIAIEMFRNIYL